jgi:hypothetical protein
MLKMPVYIEFTDLLVSVHGCDATRVRGLAALLSNVLNLFLGAVGEVSGVVAVGHSDGCFGNLFVMVVVLVVDMARNDDDGNRRFYAGQID